MVWLQETDESVNILKDFSLAHDLSRGLIVGSQNPEILWPPRLSRFNGRRTLK